MEKYEGLSALMGKIRSLSGVDEKKTEQQKSDTKCPELSKYFQFWAKARIFGAIVQMVQNALKDYYILIKGLTTNNKDINPKFLKYTYTPLF